MPSIHDRVLFYSGDYSYPLAAIVTGIINGTIYLHVMPPGGTAFDTTTASQGTDPGQWSPL